MARGLFLLLLISNVSVNSFPVQEVRREEVIAAYVFNFGANLAWPDNSRRETFRIVVVANDRKVYDELANIAATKRIHDKKIVVAFESGLPHLDDAQLLFVAKDRETLVPQCYDMIAGKNVLLVTDEYADKKSVMINFRETRDRRVLFEINKANILNQGLAILPDLVLLGGTEIDVAALYRESQKTLGALQKQVTALQEHEESLKREVQAREREITRQRQLLGAQSAAIDSQSTMLAERSLELENLLRSIALKQDTLRRQTEIIAKREIELGDQKAEISRREKVLDAQEETIRNQDAQIVKQARSLEEQGMTISSQHNLLVLLVVIAVLSVLLSLTIYNAYRHRRIANARLTKEIEDRRRVEDALGKSEDLYNFAPCGYHSLDKNGVFVRINDTELQWLGYSREEVVGKMSATDIMTKGTWNVIAENLGRLKEGATVQIVECELVRKDGSVLPVQLNATASVDKDGNFVESRSSIFDITERKLADEKIRTLNRELESRVVQRTSQLEAANKELEAFAYSVSHDLRAPLRGILGFGQMLLEDYGDRLDEEGKKYLDHVLLNTERMTKLIDALLSLSRVNRSALTIASVNLSEMVQRIAEDLKESRPDRKVTFVITEGIEAACDSQLMRIALENLIGNAWKYTSKHSEARIEFGGSNYEGERYYFVRDDGAGFEMQYAGKLFGAFQRLHSEAEFAGTGIGLATVQRIISRHGGRVWAEGAPEKGATFSFTLPS
jgi:PAS domain S-box-containing protein